MSSKTPLVALLLLGGAGTRLWPLSTEQRPKQFLKLFGDRSLFQLTVERLRAAGCEHLVIMTNAALASQAAGDLAEIGIPPPSMVLEPLRRDSGPAIAAGVAVIRARFGDDAIVAVMPADHLIRTDAQFATALDTAKEIARAGWLTTYGIRPTGPATVYGYIERGGALPGFPAAHAVARFHEKPEASVAERYLRLGSYDWNSGIFLFSVDAFMREAGAHMPDIWETAQRAVAAGVETQGALTLDAAAFAQMRKTSIDYALFEKSQKVATVPAGFEWSDVGNWDSVYDALAKDAHGNVTIGDVRMQDCSGSLAVAEGVSIALAGLSDMVVVATREGTFAAPRARAADVKQLLGER
jgi:mannose-1-phosphate guanylyltransferase/mannose-6-phosphate isomerase